VAPVKTQHPIIIMVQNLSVPIAKNTFIKGLSVAP